MIQIRYYLNYKMITLDESPEGDAFLVTRSGDRRWKWWLGFIDVEIARQLPGGRPVKIDVNEFSYGPDFLRRDWTVVPRDKCIQGCLVRQGVYGITVDGKVRVLPRPGLRYRI